MEARALRWKLFEDTLDAGALREHIAHLPDFEDVDALDAAFVHALASPLIYAALRFLIEWPRLDLAERLVAERHDEWDGRRYEILAPAAEALASGASARRDNSLPRADQRDSGAGPIPRLSARRTLLLPNWRRSRRARTGVGRSTRREPMKRNCAGATVARRGSGAGSRRE